MKHRTSLFLRALCFAMTLCIVLGALSLTALAADGDLAGTELVNRYNRQRPNDQIAVQPGDVVYVGPTLGPGNPPFLKAHRSSGDTNIAPNSSGVQKIDSFGYYDIYAYTVPQGVTAVTGVVSARNGKTPYAATYMVTVNQKLTKKNFNEYWEATDKASLDLLGKKQEVRTDLSLYQRSALFIGDSITHASLDDSTYHHSWAGRIGEVNDMRWVNAGVDGASVSWRKPTGSRMITQLRLHERNNYDYIIMWGGINDAYGDYTIGNVSTSKDPTTFDSTNTFVGALENFFYEATTKFEGANLGYIITYPVTYSTGSTSGFHISDWGNYVEQAIAVCNKWEVPYLDLYHDTDYCNNVLKINTTEFLPDNLHPNGQAYDLLYLKIQAWMDTLDPLPPAPPADSESNQNQDATPVDTTPTETTTAPVSKANGCGASVSAATAVLTTTVLGGAAVCMTKKDKKKRK